MKQWLISLALLLPFSLAGATKAEQAVQALSARLLPHLHADIEFVELPAAEDFYVLESIGGKIRISGNNANSMAMGLGDYLRDICLITPTWFSRDAVKEPRKLPAVKGRIERRALVKDRFFLNYCTYGYTVALRSVTTDDFMSADWTRLPYEVLEAAGTRIPNEVKNVSRVVYDITSKPPATVEWE